MTGGVGTTVRYSYSCTCVPPVVVELDETVVKSEDGTNSKTKLKAKALLTQNLQTLGWCPIRVPVSQLKPEVLPPTKEEILHIFQDYHERIKITENASSLSAAGVDLVYKAAESGSSQVSAEPKESLEIELSKCNPDIDANPQPQMAQENRVKRWCLGLSSIAHQVCEVMGIPPNTFLHCKDEENYHHTTQSNQSLSDSIDLLRVFHYYAVCSGKGNGRNGGEDTKQCILGSNDHTDWGSLTIVWQDDVGGLQTFCRACQRWNDVKPPPHQIYTQQDYWHVIVHIGDMASLLLDTTPQKDLTELSESSSTKTDDSVPYNYSWPSPKHRVVNNGSQDRVSLVYFGYPPSYRSLKDIQASIIQKWNPPSQLQSGRSLPLSDYFLLRDQTSVTDEPKEITEGSSRSHNYCPTSAEAIFHDIWNLPVRDIIEMKWKQVNRDSS